MKALKIWIVSEFSLLTCHWLVLVRGALTMPRHAADYVVEQLDAPVPVFLGIISARLSQGTPVAGESRLVAANWGPCPARELTMSGHYRLQRGTWKIEGEWLLVEGLLVVGVRSGREKRLAIVWDR